MDVLSTGGLPMGYYLGVWVYVLHASASGPVYPSRREDTIESWTITAQLVLCLCSSLVTSAQQAFTWKNIFWDGLSVSASKHPVYIRRCCGKGYFRKVFDPDKFGGEVKCLDLERSLCTLNRSYWLLYIYGKEHWRFPIPDICLFSLITLP